MGAAAAELVQVTPSLFIWQCYEPTIKSDLFSTALITPGGIFVVDPIHLERSQFEHLLEAGRHAAIIVTNANHQRASTWYSKEFSAPIFAAGNVFVGQKPEQFVQVRDAEQIENEIEIIEIEGAVTGEVALYHKRDGGTLIVGDALINFEPYGFTFLPRKYCRDEKQMRRSLRKLLDREAQRIFFGHGQPILSHARTRLRQLLDNPR
jgi:glyoxylase-like metal-dependent hydrolase (beta-lactamase superfamily II)